MRASLLGRVITTPVVQVDLDDGPVVYLGEGAQLGYLPQPVCEQLGW
jgi:hypothetical protein